MNDSSAFVCAHPSIDPAMHTPLMLQTVLGLDAARIAHAFLVQPKTMGQRLFRAKTKFATAVSRLKFQKSAICRRGSMPCLRRSTLPLESAGMTCLVLTSVAAIWPRKPSGLRGFFESCPARQRFTASGADAALRSTALGSQGEPTDATFLFRSRTPGNGHFL